MTGIPGTDYNKDHRIVEFKYATASKAKQTIALEAPLSEDAGQGKRYAATVKAKFPYYNIRTYVCYVAANKGYRLFEVG